jgi:hypothetical protein
VDSRRRAAVDAGDDIDEWVDHDTPRAPAWSMALHAPALVDMQAAFGTCHVVHVVCLLC